MANVKDQNKITNVWNNPLWYLQMLQRIQEWNIRSQLYRNFPEWLQGLKTEYTVLERYMEEEEIKEVESMINECQLKINKSDSYLTKSKNPELNLRELDMKLSRIIKKNNLDMPTTDDPAAAIL